MAEEPQFHITVVTQQRRRSGGSPVSPGDAHGQSDAPKTPQSQAETPKPERARAEASKSSTQASHPAAEQTGQADAHHHAHSHTHSHTGGGSRRRHYRDYGTVNLGPLNGDAEEEADFTADPDGPTPSQGELQKQFYKKYNDILNRRYFTRNRNKVTRIILIALLVGLIFVVSVIGIGAIHGSVAETLERPEVSTVPVGTLDLG